MKTKHTWLSALLLILLTFYAITPQPAQSRAVVAQDWPQVQGNPQRTGYSPEIIPSALKVLWTHPFQPEKIYPQVQAIVVAGNAYVGTEMGNLYALNAEDGTQRWVFRAGAPILASVAVAEGRVFFGALPA